MNFDSFHTTAKTAEHKSHGLRVDGRETSEFAYQSLHLMKAEKAETGSVAGCV